MLMANLGLTLEAACRQVESELEALRRRIDCILSECTWEDVPGAMRTALDGVSPGVAEAYLDESTRSGDSARHDSIWHHGALLH